MDNLVLPDSVGIFLSLLPLIIIIWAIYYSFTFMKKKVIAINNYCNLKGYNYFTEDIRRKTKKKFFKPQNNLEIFKKIVPTNFFKGQMNYSFSLRLEGNDAYVTEMSYSSGSGNSRSTTSYSILLVDTKKNIPNFSLTHELYLFKFLSNDINFDEFSTFSKKFYLQGNNEEEIRNYFSKELITSIEENGIKKAQISTHNNFIIYAKSGQLPQKHRELDKFISEAYDVIKLFK